MRNPALFETRLVVTFGREKTTHLYRVAIVGDDSPGADPLRTRLRRGHEDRHRRRHVYGVRNGGEPMIRALAVIAAALTLAAIAAAVATAWHDLPNLDPEG